MTPTTGWSREAEEPDVTLHLARSRRQIYTMPPIRINCAERRRKYAAKDIGARYYDANERSECTSGGTRASKADIRAVQWMLMLSREEMCSHPDEYPNIR